MILLIVVVTKNDTLFFSLLEKNVLKLTELCLRKKKTENLR